LGRKWPKPAQVDLHSRALVSAIFIEIKYHSLLHSSGNKLALAKVLIFTFLMVKYIFFTLPVDKILKYFLNFWLEIFT
jgi:hypothetical protein